MNLRPTFDKLFEILVSAEQRSTFLKPLLDQAEQAKDVDPNLLRHVAKGVLEKKQTIDHALSEFIAGKRISLELQTILRLGAYQILFLDGISKQIIVNECVELAKRQNLHKAAGMVNAVLRRIEKSKEPDSKLNFPSWLIKRWSNQFGEAEALAICNAMNLSTPLTLRVNTLLATRAQLLQSLANLGLNCQATKYSSVGISLFGGLQKLKLGELPQFKAGEIYVQDEASQLIVDLLEVHPGDVVFDLCAAPGGKSTHLAALMNNQGKIVACDLSAERLRLVEENCRRLEVRNVQCVCSSLHDFTPDLPCRLILLDAPCSGSGILGKQSESRWIKRESDFDKLAESQIKLLKQAAKLLEVGGRIVYSTCSIDWQENEAVIQTFLASSTNFVVRSAANLLSPELVTKEGYLRTYPNRHAMAGGFAAILEKLA